MLPSLPSHISNFYYHISRKFKLEKFEIENIEIEEFYPNTFDKEGRPIFDDGILFNFGLIFHEEDNSIDQVAFHDFYPEEASFRRMKAAFNID